MEKPCHVPWLELSSTRLPKSTSPSVGLCCSRIGPAPGVIVTVTEHTPVSYEIIKKASQITAGSAAVFRDINRPG